MRAVLHPLASLAVSAFNSRGHFGSVPEARYAREDDCVAGILAGDGQSSPAWAILP